LRIAICIWSADRIADRGAGGGVRFAISILLQLGIFYADRRAKQGGDPGKYHGLSAPKVLISYSHDSPEHKTWVLELARFLVQKGIDVMIDAWKLRRSKDIPKFILCFAN
jgi:hypothetical protein